MRISDCSSDVCSSDLIWNRESTRLNSLRANRARLAGNRLRGRGDDGALPDSRFPIPDSRVRVFAQLGVAVDVLHVVQVFDPVEQLADLLRGLAVHVAVFVGALGDLGIDRKGGV